MMMEITEEGATGRRKEELDISSFCPAFRPCAELLKQGIDLEGKLSFVGQRLFFLKPGNERDPDRELNKEFLEAHLDHLDHNRVMLVEGEAGSGKSTLVEEIAMLYISGGACQLVEREEGGQKKIEYEGGYAIATNGTQTLTELRLFSYRDGSVDVLGPLAQMRKDAYEHTDRRYVFILHEYNRVTDFMSVLGNILESELRSYGPDSWFEGDEDKMHQAYSFEGSGNQKECIKLPPNLKIVLTSNPPRDGFAGVVGDFMADGALKHNRLLGAEVQFEKPGEFCLWRDKDEEAKKATGDEINKDQAAQGIADEAIELDIGLNILLKNKFPCRVIVQNLMDRLLPTEEKFDNRVKKEIAKLINDGINPGKIVAEVSKLRNAEERRKSQLIGRLPQAVKDGDLQTIRKIIDDLPCADVNAVSLEEDTLLMLACRGDKGSWKERLEMIKFLLEKGADPSLPFLGRNAFCEIVSLGDDEIEERRNIVHLFEEAYNTLERVSLNGNDGNLRRKRIYGEGQMMWKYNALMAKHKRKASQLRDSSGMRQVLQVDLTDTMVKKTLKKGDGSD